MSIYLIEPYNPYCKVPRKRHPAEIAEEEAIYYRIIQESLKQQELQTTAGVSGAGGIPLYGIFNRFGNMNNIFSSINRNFNRI